MLMITVGRIILSCDIGMVCNAAFFQLGVNIALKEVGAHEAAGVFNKVVSTVLSPGVVRTGGYLYQYTDSYTTICNTVQEKLFLKQELKVAPSPLESAREALDSKRHHSVAAVKFDPRTHQPRATPPVVDLNGERWFRRRDPASGML